MKFLIGKIDDLENLIDISNRITPPVITESNRTQSVNYTIGGATIIDRISNTHKMHIELTIPTIPDTEWNNIKAILKEMSFAIRWEGETHEVRLDGDIPTPVLVADSDSYLVGDIKLELDEL